MTSFGSSNVWICRSTLIQSSALLFLLMLLLLILILIDPPLVYSYS
jgi:hypothetical protein